ncbi:unnamed protein product [Phytophthora fragariaefolia]|uniref:Unnamed protein product n=1 Tax=Phytophthora fragariaefolia TaxID=1490495 RepID=A0A9W6TXI3_9STRA|nr:unnamed protein product [Phytophthora fragariaefolia]
MLQRQSNHSAFCIQQLTTTLQAARFPPASPNMSFTVSNRDLVDALFARISDSQFKCKLSNSVRTQAARAAPKLQHKGGVTLRDVRVLFDKLLDEFKSAGTCSKHLAVTSKVVAVPDFENAIVKVQEGHSRELSKVEEQAIQRLLGSPTVLEKDVRGSLGFADAALIERQVTVETQYPNLDWIPPTSDDVERLFSEASLVTGSGCIAESTTGVPPELSTCMWPVLFAIGNLFDIDIDVDSNTRVCKGNLNEIISNDGGGDSRPNGIELNRIDLMERTAFVLVSYQVATWSK